MPDYRPQRVSEGRADAEGLARRHNRSIEQEVRELLEGYVAERRAVLDQAETSWSRQARRPTAADVDAWLAIGRP